MKQLCQKCQQHNGDLNTNAMWVTLWIKEESRKHLLPKSNYLFASNVDIYQMCLLTKKKAERLHPL